MKHHIKTFLLGLCAISFFQACYKDKGNYDRIDYNEINSISLPPITSAILGDTLRVSPAIKWKYPARDTLAFDYEWRQDDSVLSNKRDLVFVPNIPGYVYIYLKVTERATGIVTRYVLELEVISAYKAGWLFLTNDNGKSGLSYIRRDTKKGPNNTTQYEYKYFPDIYTQLHPNEPLGDGPVKLVTRIFPNSELDQLLVAQQNSTVFLSGQDFSKKILLNSEFPNQKIPENAYAKDYIDGTSTNFVLSSDGKLYWKRNPLMSNIHDVRFMDVPVYFEGGGANISQIIDVNLDYSQFVYVYDELHKRFIGLYTTTGSNDYIGSKMFLVNSTTPPSGWVDLNNLAGYTFKYCSDFGYGAGFMNIIKNETTGQFLYQTYTLSGQFTYINVSNQKQEVFAGNGIVSDNTVYYRIRNSSYLFFGEGSKLYFYDVNTKRVTLYHDFGAGRITKITTDADSGELGVVLNTGYFHICSLKNEVLGSVNPGATGILYSSPRIGNITDLAWKWGSYYEYLLERYPS